MKKALKSYLNQHIIPLYQSFDQAHQMNHVQTVIKNSLEIAKDYDVKPDMVYVIACYHDIGMQFGRNDHHLTGGLFLFEDETLKSYFTMEERTMMKEAVEDHRASRKEAPRSIYGKIIAEADRDIDPDIVILRTVLFGLKHYPDLNEEDHFLRAYQHIVEKYGPNGYLKLWLDTKKNSDGLLKIHRLLEQKDLMKSIIINHYRNFHGKDEKEMPIED
jgi:uncharacterized protein